MCHEAKTFIHNYLENYPLLSIFIFGGLTVEFKVLDKHISLQDVSRLESYKMMRDANRGINKAIIRFLNLKDFAFAYSSQHNGSIS